MIDKTNFYLANGSVAGVLYVGALLSYLDKPTMQGVFTQAQSVNTVDVTKWDKDRVVGIIDLTVNMKDAAMSADLIKRITEAGHEIFFLANNKSCAPWLEIVDFGSFVMPPAQSDSLGSYLKTKLKDPSELIIKMLDAASEAEKGIFSSDYAKIVNEALKSKMGDEARRPHLAMQLAALQTPEAVAADEKINGWMKEYQTQMANHHAAIIQARVALGDGIFLYDGLKIPHDATSLMMSQYSDETQIVVLRTTLFVAGKPTSVVTIGTHNEKWDLLTYFAERQIPNLGGIRERVNFETKDEDAAIAAVRELVK